MMSESSQSPTDYKLQLADLLTKLRKAAGLSRGDAAKALRCKESAIGTYERGRSVPGPTQLPILLRLYGVPEDQRSDIEALGDAARERRQRTEWGSLIAPRLRKFFDIEAASQELRHYHPELLHGLVQREEYASSIVPNTGLVRARLARQDLLKGPVPLRLKIVIPESALHVVVGSVPIMRDQLHHCIRLIEDGTVDMRVVRAEAGFYASRGNKYTIMVPRAGNRKTVVYLDNLTDGVWVDDEDRVHAYQEAFDEVYGMALPPDETVALLAKVAEEL